MSQLRMRLKSLEQLPDLEIPDGFDIWTFRAGDAGGWANLMTGAIGDWNEHSTARDFLGDPGVNPDGVFFLISGGQHVGTATDKRLPDSGLGYLHMVVVAPEYRGRRLGSCISLAALHHMRERGCREAILDTDDYRLPAIRTYLRLGFVPDNQEADHAARWRTIDANLRPQGASLSRP